MSQFKSFNLSRGRKPRTFAFQLLLTMLAVSLIPLILLSVFTGQTVRSQLLAFNETNARLTEQNYLQMYQSNIEEQAFAIGSDLRKVEDAVLVTKAMAESLFASEQHMKVTPIAFAYSPALKGYRQKNADDKGIISIRNTDLHESRQPTMEQSIDFARMKALFPIFHSETSRNSNIVSMYYIHPQSGSFYYPLYAASSDSTTTVEPLYKLTSYNFYTDALNIPPKEAQVVWTKPYLDITPRGRMFTATTPVFDEQRVLRGVVAADVTIERFVANVLNTRFENEDGYAFLLDSDYELIAAQQQGDQELSGMQLAEIFNASTLNSYRSMDINGQPKAVFSRSIPSSNWILGYIIPENKLLDPIYAATKELTKQTNQQLGLQLSLLCALAVCLCLLLAFYLRSRISRPVNQLIQAFGEMGQGQFTAKLDATPTLEFNQLLQSFNGMASKINELVEQQIEQNQQLESKVELRTEELRDMNNELEARVDELILMEDWRKQLIMNISHDLKTPITLIRGYIEAIHDGTIPPQSRGIFLERIYEGIQTITQFVAALNELGLLETRQTKPAYSLIDTAAFFRKITHKWGAFMGLEQRPFYTVLVGSHSMLSGDAHLLERVLDNLIDNAMKYSEPTSAITVKLALTEHTAVFQVIDCGSGIPEADLPYVFDSFYRVDKSRNSSIPGSGLGLAIAKEITTLHGGELAVTFNEENGQGCIFSLKLPLTP